GRRSPSWSPPTCNACSREATCLTSRPSGGWCTPAHRARCPSSRLLWPPSRRAPCGSSTAPPRVSSPRAHPRSGSDTRAPWAGLGRGGRSRSTTSPRSRHQTMAGASGSARLSSVAWAGPPSSTMPAPTWLPTSAPRTCTSWRVSHGPAPASCDAPTWPPSSVWPTDGMRAGASRRPYRSGMDQTMWIDLLDPDVSAIRAAMPGEVHPSALERLLAAPHHDDEPRPRLETHGNHLFGVLVAPEYLDAEDRVIYQEVDLLASRERLVTVRKTLPNTTPLTFDDIRAAAIVAGDSPGMCLYRIYDEVAERYLSLV